MKTTTKQCCEKGNYAKSELWAKFLESKFPEKGDIREILMDLQVN
jgi:hypothetical protein